ncbi:MAG: DUF5703 domain-containing protein [Planctomycetota bacterium]|nr:DUF5703 domain-containing protein [Planctomycetota bacterium]
MNKTLILIVIAEVCSGIVPLRADEAAAQHMGRYNVVWTTPSNDASGVMPIGNGDIAAGVYAIENGDLYLLLAKNDALSFCGDIYKTGRLRISLQPNPFEQGKPFRQTLDLPTASIRIEADGVKFKIWADANRPVYHVEIVSPQELTVRAEPEFWKRYNQWKGLDKTPDVRLPRDHDLLWYFSVGDKTFYRDDMMGRGYRVENFAEIVPDPYRHNTFGNLVELKAEGSSRKPEVKDGKLTCSGKQFDVQIHALTRQTPEPEVWVKAIEQLAGQPVDLKKDWVEHCRWWQDFWSRGWIITSDRTLPAEQRERFNGEVGPSGMREETDGAALVAQSYNMFRFYMAAQGRGRLPVKFNGGLFTQQYRLNDRFLKQHGMEEFKKHYPFAIQQADGSWLTGEDYRAWGRRFTAQNERLLYWPLLMSGDFDLMKPFFDYYWNVLELRKAITLKHYGHAGAFYRENVTPITGTEDWEPPLRIKAGEKYTGNHLMFHHTSGLEALAMMADYVNHTGDMQFRDQRLVPFAQEILRFFDLHYPRDPNGKLRLEPSQALETWWVTVNPATDVAGLRFCLDQLLAIKAGTDEDRKNWNRFRAEIPEVPLQTVAGRQLILAAEQIIEKQKHNGEIPEIYPAFPFRCYGFALGTGDVVDWTMQNRINKDTFGGKCWTHDQLGWVMAGNTRETAAGLIRRFRWATTALRFPVYGNETTDGIPDLDHFGCGAIALQRMLVQEGQGKIFLLPAWPAEWDVDFKLHLEGGAVLTGTVKDGKLLTWDCTANRKANVVVGTPVTTATEAGFGGNAKNSKAKGT